MNPTLFFVFIFAALTVYALFRVVSPFLASQDEQIRHELLDEELREIEQLVARKSVLLQSLKDIEFDRETGKLAESDYERLRNRYEREALQVMRQLDEVRGGVDLDDEIDAAVRERLERELRDAELETERTGGESDDEALACPECDKELEPEARFCSRCGTSLEDSSEANSPAADDVDDRAATGDDGVAGEFRSEATG